MPATPFTRRCHLLLAAATSVFVVPTAHADLAPRPLPRPVPVEAQEAASFAAFRAALVRAVKTKDVNAVVKHCTFPLRSYEMGAVIAKAEASKEPVGPEVTEAAFRKHFARLFPAAVVKNLQTAKALRHTVDDDDAGTWYSVGHSAGKTWSAWFVFAGGAAPGGVWTLRGTDNVSQ